MKPSRSESIGGVAISVARSVGLGALLGIGAAAALGLWLIIVGAEKAFEALEDDHEKVS